MRDVPDNRWYPDDPLDAVASSRRASVAAELAALAPLVPTAPGPYLDREGRPWTPEDDGQWYDEHGATRPPAWNPLLAHNGLRPVSPRATPAA